MIGADGIGRNPDMRVVFPRPSPDARTTKQHVTPGTAIALSASAVRLAAFLAIPLTGCFFVDSIDQRPSIAIRQESTAPLMRGGTTTVAAETDDPENDTVTLAWTATACSDVSCDPTAFAESSTTEFTFSVPTNLADGEPTTIAVLTLDGVDAYGAAARPQQQLHIPVLDAPPSLELRKVARHDYVVGTPVDLYAKVGDVDDAPTADALFWSDFAPSGMKLDLVSTKLPGDPTDPTHAQESVTIVPEVEGEWIVQVLAIDPAKGMTQQSISLTVAGDRPPCLGQWSPIAPPAGETLPISEPTLFSVPVVIDDLDVYPPVPGDPYLGETEFDWSLLPPGASARIPAGTGNSVAFDPSAYAPGSVAELRVEIYDRNHTPITCADDDPTCSVVADDSCIQRQTWRVEVR